ncbi:type VI secretion system protein TssA [Vibrio vulnificus]|uniref:type VI secretion system protein TssA n=1 Tax=Vibrio vulnificus TaxID=672 RepID=UPI0005F1CDB0|nr:type VI secretion system protein TssA [Vibrio vulnificus]ELP1875766.1 type VI secretion system protein TssA [Vibrio vulnificus]MCA3909863.1 type VI secretion system protein TssA [Vibrio vulnificus]
MEINQYRQCISKPVTNDNPIGERLVDHPLFDFIEEQMMKVGSLSHATVQWEEVEHSTIKLLSEQSKDIKLLVYLLQCLHNQITPLRFITSFLVMSEFIEQYWNESYPAPGARGNLPRRKYFSQMTQRFSTVVDKFDFCHLDAADRQALQAAVGEWKLVIEKQGLLSDLAESIAVRIEAEIQRAEKQQSSVQNVEQMTPSTPATTFSSSIVADHSSDKAAKQTLLKVADFLAEQNFGIPLSIRLRRFAVWGSITSLPDHNPDGQTLLRSMQADRVKDYQAQLRHADLALWRKVEQSLTMSPYWFEGQWMSYTIAQQLGKSDWCEAIAEETKAFLDRLPSLFDLKFKDGDPFVSESVREWLANIGQKESSSVQAIEGGWQEKRKVAFQLAKEGGIAVALSMLNDGLVSAVEPRDKFYWRLLSADLLRANHLDAMAGEQYQTLLEQATTMSVPEWEPSLIEQIQRYTTSE